MDYNHQEIEQKWKQKWQEADLYKTPTNTTPEDKYYCLDMFPYPSGAGLHVGHVEGYTATDIISRFMRMQGKDVLHPMGWDAFGLPAENYAIKTGVKPRETTDKSIQTFKSQINNLGLSYDWDRELGTHNPDYYKWTQWLFIQLFKAGLAYRKKAPVNWCPTDQTVLANEQVVNGRCERCDTIVIQKDMEQWFFKITDYAEKLLDDLATIDWPDSTKAGQRNWIGKSEGSMIKFPILDKSMQDKSATEIFQLVLSGKLTNSIEVFSTRADTLFSATFLVLAPENPLVDQITTDEYRKQVEEYKAATTKKTELQRASEIDKEKTGVFTGAYVINPVNGNKLPVWIADFVIGTYGTGAVFADAHDERDFQFATKYGLEIRPSLHRADGDKYIGYVQRAWSNDFDAFVKGLDKLNANYKQKEADKVLFVIDGKEVPQFLELAKASVKEGSWHDIVGNKYYMVVPGKVYEVEKYENNDEVWNLQKRLVPDLAQYNNMWDMLFNSDYKEYVCLTEYGILFDSDIEAGTKFSGLDSATARTAITDWLAAHGLGERKITYRLRDWLVSRQRYWGAPIPMIYCEECAKKSADGNSGWHPVPEDQLPVLLPEDVDFKPTGKSPLADSHTFQQGATCPECGGVGRREIDTMDTFVDSSWYFFRFSDNKNDQEFASREAMQKWLPVDLYVGGAEHTVLHLLYARFFTKFLNDQGYITFNEPFAKLRHPGIILAEDGRKMSKRWGNVINPDDEITKFGADTVRMYEMFMGPLKDSKPWSTRTEQGVFRFMNKVWNLQTNVDGNYTSEEQERQIHKLIKYSSEAIPELAFNTTISKFMEFANFLSKESKIAKSVWERFLILMSPFAPFSTEEMWSRLENAESIHLQKWPTYDAALATDNLIVIGIQVNGKLRSEIEVNVAEDTEAVKQKSLAQPQVQKWTEGKEVRKFIYVPGKIINIIV